MKKLVNYALLCIIVYLWFLNSGESFPASKIKWNYSNYVENEVKQNGILQKDFMYEKLKKTQEMKSTLKSSSDLFHNFFHFFNIKKLIKTIGGRIEMSSLCLSCKFAIALLQRHAKTGATEDEIGALVNRVCTMFHIEKPRVCAGLTKLFKREVTLVLANVTLDPNEFCGVLIGHECGKVVNPLHNWTVPMTPFPKPDVKPIHPPFPGAPVTYVLHLSDTHLDPLYKEGSNANCGEPLCCREASSKPLQPSDVAGPWGDYRNCDTPLRTLENMLSHINKTHKVDYVIWTGDIPPHDIWNNTRDEAAYLLHAVSKIIHKHFGHIPIFPALGNHESSPVNSFPMPEIKGNDSISWLYNEVVRAWSPWLPGSRSTLGLGAYYSVPVYLGFRIISINMNYCNTLNWWLLLNSTDPANELHWLVTELQMAEDRGEKVHIIGHIPPGEPDCLSVWSRNYYEIINRYESTVTAQFFGHTHRDEFEIFYDASSGEKRPTNIVYIGPSVTTYDSVNPGYRIYTVDGNYPQSSRAVLDHETYYLNLTEANLYNKPKWRLEYSAKKTYNMTSLVPSEWDALTKRFEMDDALFQKFYRFYNKLSDYPFPACDKDCKSIMLCRLRRGQAGKPLVC